MFSHLAEKARDRGPTFAIVFLVSPPGPEAEQQARQDSELGAAVELAAQQPVLVFVLVLARVFFFNGNCLTFLKVFSNSSSL